MSDHIKNFTKLFEANCYRFDRGLIFSDFVAMLAAAISNAVDKRQFDEREAEYMRIIGKYSKEEADRFAQMYALLVAQLEKGHDDVLGKIFMDLNLGGNGQFFTPYHMSKMMAEVTLQDCGKVIEDKGFISVSDPCVGGGALVIAASDVMIDKGFNPQRQLHVTAVDLDIRAVHMAYIQLSLLGIPAVVVHGNTLTQEEYSRWYTPFHILHGWNSRLAAKHEKESVPELFAEAIASPDVIQFELFEVAI